MNRVIARGAAFLLSAWIAASASLATSATVYAQGPMKDTEVYSLLQTARQRSEHSVPFPISLLLPEGLRVGYAMRDFISSPEFGRFDSSRPPEEVMDEIYFTSEIYTHGDTESGLLAAAFGVIEHETIPLLFLGGILNVPLTGEDHSRFGLRRAHLPEHIYHTPEGDRDKLQHFFASGWLREVFGMDWLAGLAGTLVEVGEDLFVAGGSEDPRDLHANADGIHFAVQAERDGQYPPSAALTPNP